jgi:hypothetical protein
VAQLSATPTARSWSPAGCRTATSAYAWTQPATTRRPGAGGRPAACPRGSDAPDQGGNDDSGQRSTGQTATTLP